MLACTIVKPKQGHDCLCLGCFIPGSLGHCLRHQSALGFLRAVKRKADFATDLSPQPCTFVWFYLFAVVPAARLLPAGEAPLWLRPGALGKQGWEVRRLSLLRQGSLPLARTRQGRNQLFSLECCMHPQATCGEAEAWVKLQPCFGHNHHRSTALSLSDNSNNLPLPPTPHYVNFYSLE